MISLIHFQKQTTTTTTKQLGTVWHILISCSSHSIVFSYYSQSDLFKKCKPDIVLSIKFFLMTLTLLLKITKSDLCPFLQIILTSDYSCLCYLYSSWFINFFLTPQSLYRCLFSSPPDMEHDTPPFPDTSYPVFWY